MISLIGLIFILIGWIAQLVVMRTDRKINPVFITFYMLGTALIIYEDYFRGWIDLSVANLLILLVSLGVFVFTFTKERKKKKKN